MNIKQRCNYCGKRIIIGEKWHTMHMRCFLIWKSMKADGKEDQYKREAYSYKKWNIPI